MTNRHHSWLPWTLGSVALLALAGYPLAMHTATADASQHAPQLLEHNPRIHKALEALHDARKELDEARHDFHGKKQKAIEAIDSAIERLDEIKDFEG